MVLENTLLKRKADILNILKKGEMVSTKLSNELTINKYNIDDTLNILEKEGKVKKRLQGKGVYWSLNRK